MNEKTAKKLRRMARELTIGKPVVSYDSRDHFNPGRPPVSHARPNFYRVHDPLAQGGFRLIPRNRVQVTLADGCGRHVYRTLKKAAA